MTHLVPVLRPVLGTPFRRGDLYRRAGEVPSFHIAPARTQNARDLITGSVLGTYNSASPAWAVGPDGVLALPAANAPVLEYDPTTLACLGARIWGVVANPRPYSERILASPDVADYSINNATLVQQTTATPIQGLNVASKLTLANGANTGNNQDGMTFGFLTTLASNTVHTQSIFVKAAGSSVLRLRSNVTGQVFDIPIAGPAPTPTFSISACTVQVFPNGWSRISWTFTTTTGAPGARADHWTLKTDIANGTDGILMTGAQFNTGPLGPYVPTTTLAASSTADAWSITGADFSRIINQAEGTVYWSGSAALDSSTHFGWAISSSGDYSNSHNFMRQSDAQPVVRTLVGGAPQYEVGFGANWTSSNPIKQAAYAYKQDDFAGIINGAALVSDASGSLPTTNRIELGALSGGQFLNGYIRELAIFRSRRPNANLQAMTS